jgi:hypothetical protein
MLRSGATLAALVAATAFGGVARANPASLVPSSDAGQYVFVGIDYEYEVDSTSIHRERVGDPTLDPLAPLHSVHDLTYQGTRHTITPRIDIGGYKDTWVYAALPIIVQQTSELHLDSGVDRTTSTTVVDGLVPATGFDAQHVGMATSGDLLFRGANRHGLDQIHLGLAIAPMNQHRDATKPTWKIGAEVRLPIGKIMRFDAMNATGEDGVGWGLSEVKVWTSFDRRLGWVEPWLELWWMTPFASTSSSLFQNPGFGATNVDRSQRAGMAFGFEAYAIDDKKDRNRVSLDLSASAVAHFEGREYTEMWEVFAFAGDSRTPTNPLVLDADPTTPGVQALSHPGITNIENYLELAARAAIRAELGPHVRFAAFGEIRRRTDHAITFTNAGIDHNGNGIIDSGTNEVNPLHVPLIDLVGHRYLATGGTGYIIGAQGTILF